LIGLIVKVFSIFMWRAWLCLLTRRSCNALLGSTRKVF